MDLLAAIAAYVLGPTGTPTPDAAYVQAAVQGYLEPNGYTTAAGDAVAMTTPEANSGTSYIQGEADVIEELALLQRADELSPADPTYFFGYSQSSTILSAVDSYLHTPSWVVQTLTSTGMDHSEAVLDASTLDGIDPASLHLVLVGDPAADPGTGIPAGFDVAAFTQHWLHLFGYSEMEGINSNNDLSPTDVYTINGDNWAQASQMFGIPDTASLQHLEYLGLSASDFTPVATVGETEYFNATLDPLGQLGALLGALTVDLAHLGL